MRPPGDPQLLPGSQNAPYPPSQVLQLSEAPRDTEPPVWWFSDLRRNVQPACVGVGRGYSFQFHWKPELCRWWPASLTLGRGCAQSPVATETPGGS